MRIVGAVIAAALPILGGCAGLAESMRQAEAQRQAFAQQCAARGGVIYNSQCMSQQQAFAAEQAERDRQAMLQAVCIRRGGAWSGSYCSGGSNDVNVNVRRY